jgi:hypothetical protein
MPLVLAFSALAIVGCKPQPKDGAPPRTPRPLQPSTCKPISAAAFQVSVSAQTNKKVEEPKDEEKKALLEGLEGLDVKLPGSREAERGQRPASRRSPGRARPPEHHGHEVAAFQNYAKSKTPTDEELEAEYDTQIAAMPKAEYHAAHILLKDEAAARDALAQLANEARSSRTSRKKLCAGRRLEGSGRRSARLHPGQDGPWVLEGRCRDEEGRGFQGSREEPVRLSRRAS